MAVNHVELNGTTVLDLRRDTVTSQTLLSGQTAHDAAGQEITGQYVPPAMTVVGHKLTMSPAAVQGTKIIT